MESYLIKYAFEIRTLSPVFIGSGEISGKKEYLYDRNANEISFFDLRKMYTGLIRLGKLDAFEEYMLHDRRDLFAFFKHHQIYERHYRDWVDYKTPVGDRSMVSRSASDVLRFVKDGHGQPYVPGSSLKGALRNILMSEYYVQNAVAAQRMALSVKQEQFRNRRNYMAAVDQNMANEVFHKAVTKDTKLEDMQNDVLRGLIISDSEPLDKDTLCVCQKIDYSVDGEAKRLPILRECIKPNTVLRFYVTIDQSICPFTTLQIAGAVSKFYELYRKEFSGKFRGVPEVPYTEKRTRLFFLGGGAGYATKTVTYAQMQGREAHQEIGKIIHNTLSYKQKQEHDHLNDVNKGVSPHVLKGTIFDGKAYQMGACWLKSIKKNE